MNALRPLALVLLAATFARADSFVGLYQPDYPADANIQQTTPIPSRYIKHLVYPVIGFPSLVEPQQTINLQVWLPNAGTTNDWQVSIQTAASATPLAYSLTVTGNQQFDATTGVYTVEVSVPATVPPALYDVNLTSSALTLCTVDHQPNAVRVLDPNRTNPSFAIIADSQLQDLNTEVPPSRLVAMLQEIQLRAPDFVLFCGDLNFGSDYDQEFEQNYQIFSSCGLPIFYVPGNHDGYATVIPQSSGPNPPGVLQRDGLNYWKRYIGPTLYSFDWLNQHFVGINSMSGPPERRNSAGILVGNFGGQVDPPEMAWVEQDVASATQRGKHSVLFMHHDSSQQPTGNQTAYPFPIPTFGFQIWNDPVSKAQLDSIVASYDVSYMMFGHIHVDSYAEVTQGTKQVPYVATTTIDCGPLNVLGYRWVQTQGGTISEINYQGQQQQSVPFPATEDNLEATYSGPRDGSQAALSATVTSQLLTPASVTVELPIQNAANVQVAGGVLESVAVNGSGVLVARVQGTVPAGGQVVLGVAPTGASIPGATAASGSTATSGSTAAPLSMGGSGGGHGGGCAIGHGDSTPAALAPLLLLLVFISKKSACSRRGVR